MEADIYEKSWDSFLEAYADIKKQRDDLVTLIDQVIAVAIINSGSEEAGNFVKQQLGRILNGESISDSKSRYEVKSGD